MKKISLVLYLVTLLSASANATDESGKGAFYLALSNMSNTTATSTFLIDELLAARCGVAPSINYLKSAAVIESETFISIALRNGNLVEARARLSSIPCEK